MILYRCYFRLRHYEFKSVWINDGTLVLAFNVTEAKMHVLDELKELNKDGLDRTLEWIVKT